MPTPARVQAARVLAELERGRRTLAELLADPAVEALPSRERAFLHELVLGSLRHQGLLDHTLCPLLDRPLLELDPAVRHALRLGAYQLLRLRVPARAAVAESVELARLEAPRAAGLVNAVLRRLAREGPPSLPAPETDPLGWLTTEGSLPRWLAERWLDRLGPTLAVARAHAFLEPPPLTFRVNPRIPDAEARLEAAGLESRPLVVPGAREAIAGRPAPLAAVGLVYLQDQGSQLVAHVAAAVPRIGRPPSRVLDACAAPGGKSTLLADLLGPETLVAAAEISPRRLVSLVRLARRWGAANVRALGADVLRPPFRRAFDAVLLDAPCSGLGTLARRPDIRWRMTPEGVARHAERQRLMLATLAPFVRPGGRLVYSVCSAEAEENEAVVLPFLESHGSFHAAEAPAWAGPFREGPFLRTRPERDRGDAFFAALLDRA